MSTTKFWKALFLHMKVPVEINDVVSVSSVNGTVWIDMNDGTTFFFSIERAAPANKP